MLFARHLPSNNCRFWKDSAITRDCATTSNILTKSSKIFLAGLKGYLYCKERLSCTSKSCFFFFILLFFFLKDVVFYSKWEKSLPVGSGGEKRKSKASPAFFYLQDFQWKPLNGNSWSPEPYKSRLNLYWTELTWVAVTQHHCKQHIWRWPYIWLEFTTHC